jgi:colicin import membrane protein
MRAQSPAAYGLSALVHGAVALLILFFSYAANSVVKDSPKIFELVAGEGNNYAATSAPALGSVGGIKVPAMPPMPATPAEPAPAEPVAPASPIQPAPETAPAPAKAKKVPDLVAQLKRTEMRRELNLERKYEKAQEAAAKRLAQEQKAAGKVSHIDAEGIREGVIGGSTANKEGGAGGRALTREEGSELEAYFALLKARIKENHAPPEGVSDSLSARVEFLVAANGEISQVRIETSSGNPEFDRSVVEACQQTRSIGPRPDGRSETVQMLFKMREDETQ